MADLPALCVKGLHAAGEQNGGVAAIAGYPTHLLAEGLTEFFLPFMLPYSASTRALSPSSEAEKQRSSFVPKENGSIIFVLFWITPRSESPVTKMVDLPEKETSNSETPGYSKLAKGLS